MSEQYSGCTGCGGVLEPGFLEDTGDSSRGYLRWIPGPLEKGLFGGAKRMGKPRADVHAFRCTACGLLALYVEGSPWETGRARARAARVQPVRPAGGGPTPPAPSPFG